MGRYAGTPGNISFTSGLNMTEMITIRDIAARLNISVATVSRALRNTYDVNKETRAKVLQMAKMLNYQPNLNATSLAKGKTNNIGIVLPFVTNYYFSTVITGIQEIAYQKGYNIMLFLTSDAEQREMDIVRNVNISGFAGFLVSSCASSFGHFAELMSRKMPVVFFDRVSPDLDTSKIVQDDYHGAFTATEHLIGQGYRKIAHLAGPRGIAMTEKRLKGFVDAHKKYDVEINDAFIIHAGFSQQCGETGAETLFDLSDIPDAVFCVNDRKAVGTMLVLKRKGIAIGRDVGVVGFTNDPVSALITPSLTTVAEPAFEIGKKSCELLIKHITKKRFPPEEIMLPTLLIPRDSTRRD